MSDCNSDLDLEGAAEPSQETSSGYVGSVSVVVAAGAMGGASASREGAVSAAGSGNILGNKRNISEVTEMREEETSLRNQINEKKDQIKTLAKKIEGHKAELESVKAKIVVCQQQHDDDPSDFKIYDDLKLLKKEKIGMDWKISETTANLTQ